MDCAMDCGHKSCIIIFKCRDGKILFVGVLHDSIQVHIGANGVELVQEI